MQFSPDVAWLWLESTWAPLQVDLSYIVIAKTITVAVTCGAMAMGAVSQKKVMIFQSQCW